jgi:hypothetical protein
MNELRPQLQQTLGSARHERGGCPAPDRLLEYAGLAASSRQTNPSHRHIQICSRCQLVLLNVQGAPSGQRTLWPWLKIAVPVAALIVLVVFLPKMFRQTPLDDGIRGTSIQLLAPVGDVQELGAFRWQSPIQAESFRVYIYDGPDLRWSGTVREPQAFPPLTSLQPGREYTWYVEAIDREGAVRMTSPRRTFSRAR